MSERIRAWLIDRLMPHGGRVVLRDGSLIVRQSAEFHAYCYGPAYEQWQSDNLADALRRKGGSDG